MSEGSAPVPSIDLDFTAQDPIPESAVARAHELMASGKLFRYGEGGADEADAALLEAEFAALVGTEYCVAFNSCGASLAAALICAGVERGDKVLMNSFTLAPVPGSVAHAGAEPVFVGITSDYHIDLDGRPAGTFGIAGCFSTQSFKHVNSGEGGLLVTDDEDVAARAVLLSGSYMLYEQHGARPSAEVFDRHRFTTPNFSMRMSALAAALVRPQLELLPHRAETWNARYAELADGLANVEGITVPLRHDKEAFVASSIQFTLDHPNVPSVMQRAAEHGVFIKWFGSDEPVGFTSRFDHWRYAPEQSLAATQAVLAGLCDMRIPLSMTAAQATDIVAIIAAATES